MPRNSTLGTVRSKVKAQTGRSVSIGTQQDAEINQVISDVQQWLASQYDWPFLKSRWTVVVSARYTTFPGTNDVGLVTAINFEREISVYTKWNNIWQPVDGGIDEIPEFNYLDSDRGQILSPIQRWQFDDETLFEVWPIPAAAMPLRFVGQRTLTELRTSVGPPPVWNDSATLDLDDLMVTYYAAAELLTRDKDENGAKIALGMGQNRMTQIRATYPRRTMECVIGRGIDVDRKLMKVVPIVVVGPS